MSNFQSSLQRFASALDKLSKEDLELKKTAITDFSQKKKIHLVNTLRSTIEELSRFESSDDIKENLALLKNSIKDKDLESARQITATLLVLSAKLAPEKKPESLAFSIKNLPVEIANEMKADLNELEKCFKSDCFRASVILCGRLLETALHRKYYEATKQDLLEKAPGIGLGNLIARLKDKNIQLDPAIAQQIHLINQVRIYSVHMKKQSFNPSKDQTQAIILYTIDVIKKLSLSRA